MILAGALLLCALPFPVRGEGPAAPPEVAVTPPTVTTVKSTDTPQGAPPLRVGYADLTQIAAKSALGKAAKANFDLKAEKIKARVETKQKMLEKQKATLQAKLSGYSPAQRASKIREYEKKVEEFRKLLQTSDKELKPMQEELLKEVYAKIEKAAAEYAAANGFSLILVKNDPLYRDGRLEIQDVTEALIRQLGE
jgi:outer membrane protein